MLRIIQIAFGVLFILVGIVSLLTKPDLASIICLTFGFSLIPSFLDKALEKSNIDLSKLGKTTTRVVLFFLFTISIDSETGKNEVDGSSQTLNQATSLILTSNEKVNSEDSLNLAKFIKVATDQLSDEDYEALSNGQLEKQILEDSTANITLLKKMKTLTKSINDFVSEKEYWTHRATRVYGLADLKAFDKHLTKAALMKDEYQISSALYKQLIEYKTMTSDIENGYKICKIALKNDSQNKVFIQALADFYFKDKKYKQAIKTYSKYLKSNTSDSKIHTKIGLAYEMTKNKSKAKAHYEIAIELEGTGGRACKRLRELTVKIVDYDYYSECCDGSTSQATGKGACSHHGGVCRRMKRPITRYTMDCP